MHTASNSPTFRSPPSVRIAALESFINETLAAAELAEMAALERQTNNTVAFAACAALEKAQALHAAFYQMIDTGRAAP